MNADLDEIQRAGRISLALSLYVVIPLRALQFRQLFLSIHGQRRNNVEGTMVQIEGYQR